MHQTLVEWSFVGLLPKLCPASQTSDQDGCHWHTWFHKNPIINSIKNLLVYLQPDFWLVKWFFICPFPALVPHPIQPTNMASTDELCTCISLDNMGNSHKNLLVRNYCASCNQTLVEWSFVILKIVSSITFPHQPRWLPLIKIEKRWHNLNIFQSVTNQSIVIKLWWKSLQIVFYQNYIWQSPAKQHGCYSGTQFGIGPYGKLCWNIHFSK